MDDEWEKAFIYALNKIAENPQKHWISGADGEIHTTDRMELSPIAMFILEMVRDRMNYRSIRFTSPKEVVNMKMNIAKGEKGVSIEKDGKKVFLYNLNQVAGWQRMGENNKVLQLTKERQESFKSKVIGYFTDETKGNLNKEIIEKGENQAISERIYNWIVKDVCELPKEIKEPLAEIAAGLIAYKCGWAGKVINKDTIINLYNNDIFYRKKIMREISENMNRVCTRFMGTVTNHVLQKTNNIEIIKSIGEKLKKASEKPYTPKKNMMAMSVLLSSNKREARDIHLAARVVMPKKEMAFKPTLIWATINGQEYGPKRLSLFDAKTYANISEERVAEARLNLARKMFSEEIENAKYPKEEVATNQNNSKKI